MAIDRAALSDEDYLRCRTTAVVTRSSTARSPWRS
jgi:hypothetical protein